LADGLVIGGADDEEEGGFIARLIGPPLPGRLMFFGQNLQSWCQGRCNDRYDGPFIEETPDLAFGDAAAAVLLEANTEGFGVVDSILHSDGSGEMQLYMKAGGSRYPASVETVQNNWHTIMWDGHAVFKAAVSKMSDVSVEMMERHNLKGEDIRFLVPHQANLRIIDATARRMGITQDKCMINIDRNGNTTAATIPSCLCDYESQLRKGDNLILSAFGGGYTWGATYVKWAYDGLKA